MDHDFAGLFKMRRKFTLPEIKCIFKQLIEVVAYLHRNKILHRDIKSANILLNDDGDVKLAVSLFRFYSSALIMIKMAG